MWSFILVSWLSTTLSCSPVCMYQQQPDVLAWENDIRNFELLDSVETYSQDAILFAGSSSIRLWTTLAHDMLPYPVIRRGYGGAKLSDLAVYAPRIIYPHPCRAIVLFVANDIVGKEDDKSPEEVARLSAYVNKTIRNRFPDTPVFWIGITPTALRWNVWPEIARANRMIQKGCEIEKNMYFIDTESAFLNADNQPKEELFMPDKLHLNARGYGVWTNIIRAELDRVLTGN